MNKLITLTIATLALAAGSVSTASADAGETTCKHRNSSALKVKGGPIADSIVCLANNERAAQGLPPLTISPKLTRAAVDHARDMAQRGYFSHNSPEGVAPDARISQQGYAFNAWGENISKGRRTPKAVVTGWMNSAGHRANILGGQFQEIGLGLWYTKNKQVHYVMTLGTSPNGPEGTITALEQRFQG